MRASGAGLTRRINRPDRCKHLTACSDPFKESLASTGGVHRCSAPNLDPAVSNKIKELGRRSASNLRADQQRSCGARSTGGGPSAVSVFSTSWNWPSTTSGRARQRTRWRPRRRRPGAPRSRGSSAASRGASPSPIICRANACWCRGRWLARAVGRSGCRRSART